MYFRGVWPQCGSLDGDPFDGIGIWWCVFPALSRTIAPIIVPLWMTPSRSCCRDGRRKRLRVVFHPGQQRSGKRRLIREGGFATRISNNVRPQDPRGGGGVQHGLQPPGTEWRCGQGPHPCQPGWCHNRYPGREHRRVALVSTRLGV